MEKVRPWCGQPSDRGRLKNRTETGRSKIRSASERGLCIRVTLCFGDRSETNEIQTVTAECRPLIESEFCPSNSALFNVGLQ